MAYLRIILLSKSEEDLIHKQSITCLREVGVKVGSKSVLELLAEKGASVDFENHIAKIPEKMVYEALETAPKKITLCGRDPKHDLQLPASTYPYSVTNGLAVFVMDKDTGDYRDCTSKDLAEFTKMADALDSIDFIWPALAAKEMQPHAQTLYELWVTMQNTSKHIQGDAIHGAHNAKAQIEMVSLIAGGKDRLKKRPIFSVVSCPIAPLGFEKGSIEAQVELARAGIPIVSLSMSLGGLSAPVTIAGMMTNANTENLASLVITQAAEAGAPHIYGSDSTPMDMASGNINYDAPEYALISGGLAQMAVRYSLPSFVSGFSTFNVTDPENEAFCEILGSYLSSICYTDITGGLGGIDSANGACFKQLLVDAYSWEFTREFMKPVDINEEKIGLGAINDVGHHGNFLTHPHTIQNLRNELTFWDKSKLKFLASEKKEAAKEAGTIVNQILEKHHVLHIDKAVINKGYDIIKAYEEKYKPE